jgi:UDP-3-O-[3-hydroxymyristoyl] glucosamine N-acyltransferase
MQMNKLTLPFTIGDALAHLHGVGVQSVLDNIEPDKVLTRFVALNDLDQTTGDAITWSRHPAHSIPGDFGLMFAPSPTRAMGNFIFCNDPHRAFFTLLRAVYGDDYIPDAEHWIDSTSSIGILSTVSVRALYGQGNVIHNSTIGDDVIIGHNCTIGGPGFGHVLEHDGTRWRVPHIGRVVIEDDVQIGSNTCIDRGCLGDTIIRKGARIDNLVHIAHNVEIGENACIVAGAVICGSVKIGRDAWIAANATVRNGVTVGAGAVVGLMANVVKDVAPGATVIGNPARVK